jgi:hypothetical protein
MRFQNLHETGKFTNGRKNFEGSETDVDGGHPLQHTFKIIWAFISVSGTTEE